MKPVCRALEIFGVLCFLAGVTLLAGAARRTIGQAAAHEYADQVLVPRFTAAWADWMLHHPEDKPGAKGSHYQSIDVGDIERGRAVRKAWHELETQMDIIGY